MSKSFKKRSEGCSSFSDEYVSNSEIEEELVATEKVEIKKKDVVKVFIDNLNIRRGPGKDFERTGNFTGIGEFELLDRKNGYGQLSSGEGWISLEFCEDVK